MYNPFHKAAAQTDLSAGLHEEENAGEESSTLLL